MHSSDPAQRTDDTSALTSSAVLLRRACAISRVLLLTFSKGGFENVSNKQANAHVSLCTQNASNIDLLALIWTFDSSSRTVHFEA